MKLKLPPKLQSPYTYNEWLDLEYDKDPKFTKTLKFLNLALINLKRTKPPTAEAFNEFTEHTAYLVKRLKKMLADKDMSEPVREFCESFFILLRKWQKGAVKIADILQEESEEEAAQLSDAAKAMQQASALAAACTKNYTTLAQTVDKALKDITQLSAIVTKGVTAPKLDAAVEQVRSEKLLKNMTAEEKKCAAAADKLPDARRLDQMRNLAKDLDGAALSAQVDACAKQLQAIEKLSKAVTAAMEKYAKTAEDLLKTYDKRSTA